MQQFKPFRTSWKAVHLPPFPSRGRSGHALDQGRDAAIRTTSTSSTRQASPRAGFPVRKTSLAALAAAGLGFSYLVYTDHKDSPNPAGIATQNVRFRRRIPPSLQTTGIQESQTRDPLSILDPQELSSSSAHLVDLPISQLIRAYIVFLASSSPTLVDLAPPTIEKLEWARDNVPLLGKPLWSLLVFVS